MTKAWKRHSKMHQE